MFMFSIQNKNQTIRFDRQPDGRITPNTPNGSTVELIGFFRTIFNSSLMDTKDFVVTFLNSINTLNSQADVVRNRIINHISDIDNPDDLMDILGFVRTTIDHPQA